MKKTTSQFKEELKAIQPKLIVVGDYINTDTKIIVEDTLGIKYMSTPYKLLQKKCPSIMSAINKNDAFRILSINIHGFKYSYKKSIYKGSNIPIIINCIEHGDFTIKPSKHLHGQGCKKCGIITHGLKKRESTQAFIKKSIKKHGYTYDYSLTKYITAIEKVIIICKKHGEFTQQPNNHLTGQGCPTCGNKKISDAAKINSYGWSFSNWENKIKNNNNIQPRLYVLECFNNNETFIKIGITMHNIKKRYPGKNQMPYNYKILFEITDSPIKIYNLEQKIKKEFKKSKLLPILKFNGMYECYEKKSKNKILNFIKNSC